MILIQLQWRQTSLEIGKIEPHVNTEGNGLWPINTGVHTDWKVSKRKEIENMSTYEATWRGNRSTSDGNMDAFNMQEMSKITGMQVWRL